eukprot:5301412-Amphidinium_carterae.2
MSAHSGESARNEIRVQTSGKVPETDFYASKGFHCIIECWTVSYSGHTSTVPLHILDDDKELGGLGIAARSEAAEGGG